MNHSRKTFLQQMSLASILGAVEFTKATLAASSRLQSSGLCLSLRWHGPPRHRASL